MSRFRQAAPDPEKAARDGVANYVPARRQVNVNYGCSEPLCDRTASWLVDIDGNKRYACHGCRAELAATTRGTYTEERI
jgi:hypothetical protein